MMKGMGKEIASGVIMLGGVAVVIVAATESMPVLAGIGALAALGTGAYQAISAPRTPKSSSRGEDKSRIPVGHF